MAARVMKAVLVGMWLTASLALSLFAAGWEELNLGEATLSIAQDWELTDQRRDVEAVYTGPDGESLRVFWWFPDEPLLGYDDEISHQTRSFPAGPALVVRSHVAGRSVVKVAFDRENRDQERLLFLIESETATPEALEAALEPILHRLRFKGDPEPVTQAPAPQQPVLQAPPLSNVETWHHDVAGNFSVRLSAGWRAYGADQPDLRRLTIVAPDGNAVFVVVVSNKAAVMDAYESQFYTDQVIPRQIDGESFDATAGLEGHAVSFSARIYAVADMSLPYNRGQAWVFRGATAEPAVMLAYVHADDAAEDQRQILRAIAESFLIGPPPEGASTAAPPPVVAPAQADLAPAASSPVTAPAFGFDLAAEVSVPATATFETVLAALTPLYGGDCAPVDPPGLPATAILTSLSMRPEAAAVCAGQGHTIVALRLPQDPRTGQAGLLGMAYLRSFLAQREKPLVLVDLAHGALITVTAADGAGIAVEVSDLADLAPADSRSDALSAEDAGLPAKTQIFSGALTAAWLPHAVRGGNFDDWARFAGGMLSVDVATQPDFGATGLKSAEPMVTLPSPSDLQSLRLQFDFDTDTTSNAVFALVPSDALGKLDWDVAEIWVAVEQKRDAAPQLVLAVQRQVQARFNITDRGDLAGLTLELRPDGMILLINAADRVLLEGRMEARPQAADLHLQVSATSPGHQVPAHLDLRGITLEHVAFVQNDPAALLMESAQSIALFDGHVLGPHFAVHGTPRGADFAEKLRIAGGLHVHSPQGDGLNGLGIYAPQPVVWLDRFGKGASARLRFEFDPAETSGFRLALGSTFTYPDADPGFPRFVLDWHKTADGTIKASRWIDRELDRLDATPASMPAVVELVLTPDGVQVLAEGFPDDILPWNALREGQSFRLYAVAKAETKADPVSMVLHRITLTRSPQTGSQLNPAPMPGVEPLPQVRHFPNPQAPWEPYGLAGLTFAEVGRFDADGAVIVDVAAKYEGGRAGVLSPSPVAVLDERIDKTPYRLTLRFDPALTDGLEVMLSNQKVADMWKGSEVVLSLVRQSGGREAGSYVLTLTKDYYAYWVRTISAQDMARWDGTMLLDLAPDTLTITMPDVVTHRGTSFVGIAKEAAFHMVVQSLSDTKYGAARMALRQVDGEWIMPRMMSARERMVLIDSADFDAEDYLDLLGTGLSEDIQ